MHYFSNAGAKVMLFFVTTKFFFAFFKKNIPTVYCIL